MRIDPEKDKIAQAIQLAALVHIGQVDKADESYILHPITVMMLADGQLKASQKYGTSIEPGFRQDVLVCAVLHDAIEDYDGDISRDGYLRSIIRERFGPTVEESLMALVHLRDESYDSYIARVKRYPIARLVKLADLEHNMNLRRLGIMPGDYVPDDVRQRFAKYVRAEKELNDAV